MNAIRRHRRCDYFNCRAAGDGVCQIRSRSRGLRSDSWSGGLLGRRDGGVGSSETNLRVRFDDFGEMTARM